MPDVILQAAERLRGVQIEQRPAAGLIRRFNFPSVPIYCDPPYLISGYASNLYDQELAGWHRETTTVTDQTSRVRQEVLWMNFDSDGQRRWF